MTWDEGSPRIGRIYSDKLVETLRARTGTAETRSRAHYEDVAAALQKRLEEVYLHILERSRNEPA